MKNRLSSRLRLTLSGVTLLTLLLMCVLVFAGMYFQTTADNREQLRQQAVQLSSYLDASDDPVSLLHGSVFTQRVTYLDTDGTVLYDSEVDASRLESHAGREEFQQARENGEAFTARSSATLGQTSLYYAKRLADGRVIRVSGTQRGMLRQVRDLLGYLLLGAVLCFGAAMAFSRPLAKRLAAPMNEVNLDQPLESDVYEELSPMLRRMAQQNARIADQMASLTAQRHELDTVLGGMKEGFVILDEKRHVLTMNNAARAMFCITNDPVGQPMIAVSRDEALLRLLDGQGTECAMQLNGMTIHLSRSHVEGGGTALLMQDVTAAQAAEASRRQFSANVSHELRTPLTTISGYAELLSSGMLQKPEDATEFGRKILAESRRLLTLIEDIIRLSRLDEGVRGEVTPVDLTALIQHCVQKLTPAAQNAQVSISASGNDPVLISGDHALLEEMLTNLLENGIKYNHAGGYVRVRAEMADGRAVVTVADNGVGIAPEDQQRVFERFYRVDKSRSKQTGGTGLGLSIVKHGAVLCFGAAMAFSRPLAKRLAAPMNEVNLDQPLESDVYEELSPMLRRMAQQNARIADQMASLTAQRHELDTVLGGMKEGFVILDEKRHVLTMNNAARAMFCITNDPVGQPMIAVSRDEALLRLLDGQGTECAMQLNGMTIHLSRSHVEGGGTALLMQDVTAAQAAEASRRQFSANVSHELRTPLTTISGYAELLSSGMLQKPEDATEFGRKILAESRRLLTLIEDIIRLSRLDEGVRGEVTPVDLTALIQHCVQKLTPAAQNAQVSISASGNDPVLISGDHALLEEMLTNLLENGIKYNHAGGYVRVRAEMADGRAVVTVADNGVGIAPEDQQRVFERFYRVDKSRSKQTGGTGLGLSIVKHGAQVHHAQIAMQSALGEGTTITLTFPAQSSGKK